MKTVVRAAFDLVGVTLPLTSIHPIRQVKPSDHAFGKYKAVVSSIREVGVIEPLIVHPQRGSRGAYLLLDGTCGSRPSRSWAAPRRSVS
jgi:hypothetical protein